MGKIALVNNGHSIKTIKVLFLSSLMLPCLSIAEVTFIGVGRNPSLYDGKIAYSTSNYSENTSSIMYWDGSDSHEIHSFTGGGFYRGPSLHEGGMAWIQYGSGSYFWNGTETTEIPVSSLQLSHYNGNVALLSDPSNDISGYSITIWDGINTRTVGNGWGTPSLWGTEVAFMCGGPSAPVGRYGKVVDIMTGTETTFGHDIISGNISLWDKKLAFSGSYGLYLWDGINETIISSMHPEFISYSNGEIAFSAAVPVGSQMGPNHIFIWDGTEVHDLGEGKELSLWNGQLAWSGTIDGVNYGICYADNWREITPINTVPVPAPGALLLGSMGIGLVRWLRRNRSL